MTIKVESGQVTYDGDDLKKLQNMARQHLEEVRPPEGTPALSETRTPFAVLCEDHGQQFMTDDEYSRQLCRPDARWTCPKCGRVGQFDDDNYEAFNADTAAAEA